MKIKGMTKDEKSLLLLKAKLKEAELHIKEEK